MDDETVEADALGTSTRLFVSKLPVCDVQADAAFFVFDVTAFQPTRNFAIMADANAIYQPNALLLLVPECGARGGGAEIRLCDTDPDGAAAPVRGLDAKILQDPSDKPNGLRAPHILRDNGYGWVASYPLNP